jgi:hypothetical protein
MEIRHPGAVIRGIGQAFVLHGGDSGVCLHLLALELDRILNLPAYEISQRP